MKTHDYDETIIKEMDGGTIHIPSSEQNITSIALEGAKVVVEKMKETSDTKNTYNYLTMLENIMRTASEGVATMRGHVKDKE